MASCMRSISFSPHIQQCVTRATSAYSFHRLLHAVGQTFQCNTLSHSFSTSNEPAPATPTPKKPRVLRERKAPLEITARAATRIEGLLGSKPGVIGVRLGVRRRGCNGMSYTLNYAEEVPKGDEEVAAHGVRVFVDPKAVFSVVGTVMDWEETALSAEFTFVNPNEKGRCGCGESFNV
mmetsp:Transcript_39305/g.72319  ORF Transcript_39305/g.72319 Transcript_39305/m.72319 type:complete len:178 (+) Transcript_39305:182-715(+)